VAASCSRGRCLLRAAMPAAANDSYVRGLALACKDGPQRSPTVGAVTHADTIQTPSTVQPATTASVMHPSPTECGRSDPRKRNHRDRAGRPGPSNPACDTASFGRPPTLTSGSRRLRRACGPSPPRAHHRNTSPSRRLLRSRPLGREPRCRAKRRPRPSRRRPPQMHRTQEVRGPSPRSSITLQRLGRSSTTSGEWSLRPARRHSCA